MKTAMSTYKAVVQDGRAVIENLDEYEDGTELELEVVIDNNFEDRMDADARKRFEAALDEGFAQAKAGNTIPAEELMAELRARHR